MTFDLSSVLLLWDPEDPSRFGLDPSAFEAAGVRTLRVNYSRIGRDPELVKEISRLAPDAVIFTRNDEMEGKPAIGNLLRDTRAGYTSISGIDPEQENSQTARSIKDFFDGSTGIEYPEPVSSASFTKTRGTFSLIFDVEQFGCARFGMPRLLPLLESRGIRATFFLTGFMARNARVLSGPLVGGTGFPHQQPSGSAA
jgi:hypothetical protein